MYANKNEKKNYKNMAELSTRKKLLQTNMNQTGINNLKKMFNVKRTPIKY